MTTFLETLADRAAQPDTLVAAGPLVELRFLPGRKSLSLRAAKLSHLLLKQDGPEAAEIFQIRRSEIPMAALREISHMAPAEILSAARELAQTLIELRVSGQMVCGAILESFTIPESPDAAGMFHWRFSSVVMEALQKSEMFAILSKRAVLACESRYSLRLYEIVALRANLRKTSEVFALDDLRQRMGVPPKALAAYANFRQKALDVAVAEINQISELEVAYRPIKTHRLVTAIELSWKRKESPAKEEADAERKRHSAGRRARRTGTVDRIVEPELPLPPPTVVANSAPMTASEIGPFPGTETGSISFGPWGKLARESMAHLENAMPDVDFVAGRFRQFCAEKKISLGSAKIRNSFVGFCKKQRATR